MQISKAFLIAFIASAAARPIYSQPASPEQQARALELLRQALSQPQQPQTAPAPAKPGPTQPATADKQEQAVQSSHGTTAPQPTAAPSPTTAQAQTKAGKGNKPAASTQVAPVPKPVAAPGTQVSSAPNPTPVLAPNPAPPPPTGLTTKQQKLADLLERYKADQLTPSEYQAERAKILAQP